MISRISFSENVNNISQISHDSKNKSKQNKSFLDKSSLLMAGLGALALGGVAFVAINSIRKPKNTKDANNQILTYVEKFNNFFSKYTNESQNVIANQSHLKNEKISDYLQSTEDFDIFRKVFTLNKESKKISYPQFIGFSNIDNKTTSLFSQLISNEWKWGFTKRKYDSAYMSEFIEMLLKESQIEKKPRFIYIENFKQFKADVDKVFPQNKDVLQTILQNNQKNNIIYITNDADSLKVNDLSFKFKDDTNGQHNLIKNLLNIDFDEEIKRVNFSTSVTSKFIADNEDAEFFKSFLKREFQKPVILSKNSNELYLTQFIEEVNKYETARLANFDCASDENLYERLLKELEKQNLHFNLYGEKTYLHITNLEDHFSDGILNILKKANTDFNVMPIIEYNDETIFSKAFNDNYNFKFGRNFVPTEKLLSEIVERSQKNDLSHITKSDFENLTSKFMESDFYNGIILQGKSDIADITINSLKNTLDLNYSKINFNKESVIDSLKSLFEVAKQAKAEFEKTGKRTLLELNNIDELLTDFSTIENRRNISRFKNFAERCAKDYKTTLIFHTTKDLDNFESASIAPHRFEYKIQLI